MLVKNIFTILPYFIVWTLSIQTSYVENIENYRTEHYSAMAKQEDGPIKTEDLDSLDFYPVDINYKCTCDGELIENADVFTMNTYSHQQKPYKKYALIKCKINKKEISFYAYSSMQNMNHPIYKNLLFVPFMDWTNGEETYGGGRYLDVKKSDIIDGKIIIDFNKAYNPWCAYSEGYNCPIPPKENHFNLAIEAGEKNYTGEIYTKQ